MLHACCACERALCANTSCKTLEGPCSLIATVRDRCLTPRKKKERGRQGTHDEDQTGADEREQRREFMWQRRKRTKRNESEKGEEATKKNKGRHTRNKEEGRVGQDVGELRKRKKWRERRGLREQARRKEAGENGVRNRREREEACFLRCILPPLRGGTWDIRTRDGK